jgi:hypothetical protein
MIALLVKFQMMANQLALNAQLASHVILEIQLENQHAQLECTHLKVSQLANLALLALCVQMQKELEYLSASRELSHRWDLLNVLIAQKVSSAHSKIKQ